MHLNGRSHAAVRVGKQCHDRVADKFIDEAAVLFDHRFEQPVKFIQKTKRGLGTESFTQSGEPTNVGKQHRHVFAHHVAVRNFEDAVFAEKMQKFAGHKARETVGHAAFARESRGLLGQ